MINELARGLPSELLYVNTSFSENNKPAVCLLVSGAQTSLMPAWAADKLKKLEKTFAEFAVNYSIIYTSNNELGFKARLLLDLHNS